jgi:hypothetical protein
MPACRDKNEPFVVITCEDEFSSRGNARGQLKDYKDPFNPAWGDHGV